MFVYDPLSGVLWWKDGTHRGGKKAGGFNINFGYLRVGIGTAANQRIYAAHDLIWRVHYGVEPVGYVEHKNGHRTDNRLNNLYLSERKVIRRNPLKIKKREAITEPNASGIVWFENRDRWAAYKELNGRKMLIGLYRDKADAIAARKSALCPAF